MLVALVAAALLLAGCGAGAVQAKDVATAVADEVERQAGARPDVTCAEDLKAEVGATGRCSLVLEGLDGEYGVTVTVTGVDGDRATFDVKVDTEPLG